jgi:hypothetical protein
MGFGGGGSGSFVLPNHEHTNVLADGGALVGATSLVDAETLDAWFASEFALQTVGQLRLIETYTEAAASGTTKTFTLPAAFDPDVQAELVLMGWIFPTATFDLNAKIGDNTAAFNYYYGARQDAAGFTYATKSAQTIATLCDTMIMQPNSHTLFTHHFAFEEGTTKELCHYGHAVSSDGGGLLNNQGWYNNGGMTTFNELVVSVSGSSWKNGSSLSLYEVLR